MDTEKKPHSDLWFSRHLLDNRIKVNPSEQGAQNQLSTLEAGVAPKIRYSIKYGLLLSLNFQMKLLRLWKIMIMIRNPFS